MLRPPLGFVPSYGPAPPGHPGLGALYPTLQPPPIALMSPVMHERFISIDAHEMKALEVLSNAFLQSKCQFAYAFIFLFFYLVRTGILFIK